MSHEGRLILLILAIGAFAGWNFLKKKQTRLTGWDVALKLGLKFNADKTSSIQPKLQFINRMQYGRKHYAFNVFSGMHKGHQVQAFDFVYEVEVMNGRNGNYANDLYSFYILHLPCELDEVTIYKEGFISKLKQLGGGNDIDFESHEFSRIFRVRSPHPKFAYDFCNARMIEYLLANTDISLEIDRNILCISFNKPLKFDDVERNLNRLVKIKNLMPEYLFT